MTPEQQTRRAWALFSRFANSELTELLNLAGVKACADRALALHQALIVWFHGSTPSLNEVTRLSETGKWLPVELLHIPGYTQ